MTAQLMPGGPVSEAVVIWVGGIGFLMVIILWIGAKTQ